MGNQESRQWAIDAASAQVGRHGKASQMCRGGYIGMGASAACVNENRIFDGHTRTGAGSTNRAESQRRWRQPIGGHLGASRRRCLHECSHWCGCVTLALAGCILVILTWTGLAGVESLDCCGADRSGSTLAHRFDLPDDAQAQPISQVCMWQALCLTCITRSQQASCVSISPISCCAHVAAFVLRLCNTAQPAAERTKETPRQKALDSWRRNPR